MRYGKADIPEDLSYTKNHLWVKVLDPVCILGWTDYIQSNAGDVNHVELPARGAMVERDQDFGSIETSKWVDRLYSPLKGKVVDVNESVINQPGLINKAPFTEGWLVKIEPSGGVSSKDLMSPKQYFEYLRVCEEGG